jgi:hypothetical protein
MQVGFKAIRIAAIAAVILAINGQQQEAQALGDVCLKPIKIQGREHASQKRAMESAMAYWEWAVKRNYGPEFANWFYSADRSMECKWDASGAVHWCTTTATPCAKKR